MFNKFSQFVVKHQIALKYIGGALAGVGTGGVAMSNLYLRWQEHKLQLATQIDKKNNDISLKNNKIEGLQNKINSEYNKECVDMFKDLHEIYGDNLHLHLHLYRPLESPQQLHIEAMGQQGVLDEHNINFNGE